MPTRKRRIVFAGSAADPPHIGHRQFIEALLTHDDDDDMPFFDLVLWYPSGSRPDKDIATPADHRVAMTQIAFGDPLEYPMSGKRLRIRYADAYGTSTPTVHLLKQLEGEFPDAEIWFATGSDALQPQERYDGMCEIEAVWFQGRKLLEAARIAVIIRKEYVDWQDSRTRPNYHDIVGSYVDPLPNIASSAIRQAIADGATLHDMAAVLHPRVLGYIALHRLYRCAWTHRDWIRWNWESARKAM
ncbi:MAG: nicotinate-nicotinamide nucleotide adenylyltransferase [bacterium]|nr:nicotinate-nicotinamide nucleotide adenylyltransferase [bacterium]